MPAWQAGSPATPPCRPPAVPPHTFTLNAPATAQLHAPDLGDPAIFRGFQTAFAATCHGGADLNLKDSPAVGADPAGGVPGHGAGVTQHALVAALAAPEQATLDAAVGDRPGHAAQAAGGLAAWQAWLTHLRHDGERRDDVRQLNR